MIFMLLLISILLLSLISIMSLLVVIFIYLFSQLPLEEIWNEDINEYLKFRL